MVILTYNDVWLETYVTKNWTKTEDRDVRLTIIRNGTSNLQPVNLNID